MLGSGGTDLAAGLYGSGESLLFGHPLGLSVFAGVLMPGDADILPALQEDLVAFGGAAASWQWTERFTLSAQLYGQTSYFDSDVEEQQDLSFVTGGT